MPTRSLLALASYLFFLSPLPALADGLITCGLTKGTTACTICDLVVLLQTLVSKANSFFALPIAALMLGYGGFLMVLAGLQGGRPQLYTKGVKVLTSAGIGILLIFGSWLLIDTLLKGIGAYQHASSANFGPWNVIECTSPRISFPKHKGCNGETCEDIDGYGQAECSEDANCGPKAQHLGCDKDGQCSYVDGKGVNGCEEGPDPKCQLHKRCVNNSCVKIQTSDPDECDTLGKDPKCSGGGLCKGDPCPDSGIDTYKPDSSADCVVSTINNTWQLAITAGIKKAGDPTLNLKTEKLVKAIISQESNGIINKISPKGACGLMQVKPADGAKFASDCGVSSSAASQCGFYTDPSNAAASICIGTKMLGNFANNVSGCGGGGGDIRNLAACYNGGSEAVRESANCGSSAGSGQCKVNADQPEETKRWECLWDDSAHTQCNAKKTDGNYMETRKYVPKVWQCYTSF